MAFTIPNLAAAAFADQAEPDSVDIDILVAAFAGTGVVVGCAVSQRAAGANLSVDVAAGKVSVASTEVAVTSGNVAVTADATNPRISLVVADNTGAKSVTAGTAAADPVMPAIPANSVVLAAVYIPAGDTAISTNQITDKRTYPVSPGKPIYKGASETVTSSTTLQNDDHLAFPIAANETREFEFRIFLGASSATGDLKVALTFPSGAAWTWAGMGLIPGATVSNEGDMKTDLKDESDGSGASIIFGTTGGRGFVIISGIVVNGATPGTVQLQHAQGTSDATGTQVRGKSYMKTRPA